MNSLYVGILFLALGLLYAVLPGVMIGLRMWVSRKLVKMDSPPPRHARTTYRIVGLIVLVLGLVNLYNYFTA